MEQLLKLHKIIPITWEFPVFPLANSTVSLVGKNIEKCDIQFVTTTFAPSYLQNNTLETVKCFEEEVNTSQA